MAADAPHFSPDALKFLRGLERNNTREWFNARKSTYEQELKTPMLAVIARVTEALGEFAPEHVRSPEKVMMRIYRDTRFSKEKIPYKTHLAGWWARAGMEKTSGGGFYLQVSAREVVVAGGCYMPEREQLLAIRRYLLAHHEELRALLREPRLLALCRPFEGLALTRAPKGFPADHPATDLLLQRQWGLSSQIGSDVALTPGLAEAVVERFRLMAPVVAFLNAPLTPARQPTLAASLGL